jgi:hypothetical protein
MNLNRNSGGAVAQLTALKIFTEIRDGDRPAYPLNLLPLKFDCPQAFTVPRLISELNKMDFCFSYRSSFSCRQREAALE